MKSVVLPWHLNGYAGEATSEEAGPTSPPFAALPNATILRLISATICCLFSPVTRMHGPKRTVTRWPGCHV